MVRSLSRNASAVPFPAFDDMTGPDGMLAIRGLLMFQTSRLSNRSQ
jgi:hypothetical protein